MLDEGGLHGVEMVGLADAFDGGDLVVGVHDGEGEAGVDAAAVDVDGAGSALAVVAALLGAGEVEVFAQAVEQGGAGVEAEVVDLAVDVEGDGNVGGSGGVGVGLLRGGRGGSYGCGRGDDRSGSGGDAGGAHVREERTAADAAEERAIFLVGWFVG